MAVASGIRFKSGLFRLARVLGTADEAFSEEFGRRLLVVEGEGACRSLQDYWGGGGERGTNVNDTDSLRLGGGWSFCGVGCSSTRPHPPQSYHQEEHEKFNS